MAAKEYTIRAIKKAGTWKGSYGDFQDYALGVKGIGEPVKLSLPQPIIEDPEVGDRLWGKLIEEKSNDGRTYYKLKLEKRPETDKREQSIHAQFAVKLAVQIFIAQDHEPGTESYKAAYDNIETEAKHFLDVLSNVKGD